ncbi:MAG: hypothetical protein CBD77_01165, partial [bacterium TMED217]
MKKKTSIKEDRRLEILGILLLAISVFIFVSLLGYNPSEEPSISPSVVINNPMGILGVFVSHLLIKLGFGYVSLIFPALGIFWGWVFFSKKDKEHPIKVTIYALLTIFLLSISIGIVSIHYDISPSKFHYSGLLAGLVSDLFIDMFSIYGCILFLVTSYLMLIRAYFDLDYYKPIIASKEKFNLWKSEYLQNREKFRKEDEKRKHTQELKAKIKIDEADKGFNNDLVEKNDDEVAQNSKKESLYNNQNLEGKSFGTSLVDDSKNKNSKENINLHETTETTETAETAETTETTETAETAETAETTETTETT